jgi:hypothetical protein
MNDRIDHRTLASAKVEQAYYLGQREGIGIGLVIGLTGALVAYPTWILLVDWARYVGLWPLGP